MARPSEDELIARHLAPLAGPGGLGLKDDAALLAPTPGHELVLTVDAIVEGVHFLPGDPPETLGWKALGVNLSDLAAKGAVPSGFLLVLALPDGWTEAWLAAFCAGLGEASAASGCPLLGGDTVRAAGPPTISVTALGEVPDGRMVRRTGAQPGDLLAVTGTIGDAVLGLALLSSHPFIPGLAQREPETHGSAEIGKHPTDDATRGFRVFASPLRRTGEPLNDGEIVDQEWLVDRYRRPRPRLALAEALRDLAYGAMDVSDGLVGDLAKMLRASGVTGTLELDAVPFSPAARAAIEADGTWRDRLVTGGDDYEVLVSLPSENWAAMQARAADAGVPITRIGSVQAGTEPLLVLAGGRPHPLATGSFQHF